MNPNTHVCPLKWHSAPSEGSGSRDRARVKRATVRFRIPVPSNTDAAGGRPGAGAADEACACVRWEEMFSRGEPVRSVGVPIAVTGVAISPVAVVVVRAQPGAAS